ncbi:MAG: DEAD/DEAH box helicase [Bdellovibrionales bacterium]|nr:DEAD/DEAH box helicase [Bdellovibrionales bacterium]
MTAFDELFQLARESAGPGDWSKAVTLSRNVEFVLERDDPEAIRVKLLERGKPVGSVVQLNLPACDWQTDCRCDEDPCLHVLASVIAFKNGLNLVRAEDDPSRATLRYRIIEHQSSLCVVRELEHQGTSSLFRHRLLDYTAGVQSGRLRGAVVTPSKEDFQVERLIDKDGRFSSEHSEQLLRALAELPHVTFRDAPVQIRSEAHVSELVVVREGEGFRIRPHPNGAYRFENGVVLLATVLAPAKEAMLDRSLQRVFDSPGMFIPSDRTEFLLLELLPTLQRVATVHIECELPKVLDEPPRAVFVLEREAEEIHVFPQIVYGTPPVLELSVNGIHQFDQSVLVLRDQDEEKRLIRRLQSELHLQPGKPVRKRGEDAVHFLEALKAWDVVGEAQSAFERSGLLEPRLEVTESGVTVRFALAGDNAGSEALADRVFSAWERQERLVPLVSGGWAEIPRDWLERYGKRIRNLLELRGENGKFERRHYPLLLELADATEAELSSGLSDLRRRLNEPAAQGPPPLPGDLTASLRDYQQVGVAWLNLMKELGTGGILADDMGLGKTLQAICILERPSLVVCPTSVIDGWCDQIAAFRPSLSVCRYHGANRSFDSTADVVVTSYALLRQEQETFSRAWKLAILDEAQQIKNPDSATAQAAFSLHAEARFTLSGTPVENKIADLWSQLHFVFPELLGPRYQFDRELGKSAERGDADALERLRKKVGPFILRRTKNQVAAELPPRTEVNLMCELTPEERERYQAIFLSSQEKVRQALEAGGNLLSALEVLLRLRQACAHPQLLPGNPEGISAKAELLVDSLSSSKDAGHRSLVFSQWTSMLDLLEPELQRAGLKFSRLDGSTKDRKAVVDDFQRPDGPDVMLLSLKAGGVGITLTAADHIYLYDAWWNPAVEAQAADRAHRIGQERPVLIHRLIVKETVEENILKLQETKRALADAILEGGDASGGLTRDDLRLLFQQPGRPG